VHTDPFIDGLIFEGDLPFARRLLPGKPGRADLDRLNDVNEPLLRALSFLMDSHPVVHGEDRMEHSQEFARLEAKLDLLLDMVGRALSRQGDVPPTVRLRLSSAGVAWSEADAPAPGSWVQVALYLHPRYLQSLEIVGQVLLQAETARGEAVVAFHGVYEPVQDLIDKFIFRHHRRIVHSHRSP
jgi:hypothetical protein